MKNIKSVLLTVLFAFILINGCGSDSSVNTGGNGNGAYYKILTAESGESRFELWSSSGTSLGYGYNNIGIKVFQNNAEKTSGIVKYKTIMYHGIGGPSHSVPVKENFYYDAASGFFKGYVIFIMYDSTAFWTADYNYNNEFGIDSSVFQISLNSSGQILAWDNTITQKIYFLTLISPLSPVLGMNDLNLMLHQTSDFYAYEEVESAEMHVKPWIVSLNQGSANNENPVYLGEGLYKGKINFTVNGEWFVYDSVKYNGTVITNSPPPKFRFDIH